MRKVHRSLVTNVFLGLFCLHSISGYSQKVEELEMGGVLLFSDLDYEVSTGILFKYNYWINPHIGFSMGGMLSYSKIDLVYDSPTNDKVVYCLDSPIVDFNGILSLKVASPVYKKIGIMTDFNFMFEPIPFNFAGIDKKTFEPNYIYPEDKSKNRIVFTRFNPSYSIEFSLFYENKTKKGRGRIALGGGISNHNPYNTYYRAKVDNLRPRDYLKLRPEDLSVMFSIRLIGTI